MTGLSTLDRRYEDGGPEHGVREKGLSKAGDAEALCNSPDIFPRLKKRGREALVDTG